MSLYFSAISANLIIRSFISGVCSLSTRGSLHLNCTAISALQMIVYAPDQVAEAAVPVDTQVIEFLLAPDVTDFTFVPVNTVSY